MFDREKKMFRKRIALSLTQSLHFTARSSLTRWIFAAALTFVALMLAALMLAALAGAVLVPH